MRKIILCLALSLDGYIEGPNGEIDWCFTDQDYGMKALFERIDTLFMGRKTFQLMERQKDLDVFPTWKRYVFSKTLTGVDTGAIVVNDVNPAQVRALQLEEGKDIWLFGGASLIQSFLAHNLVSEFILAIHPVILGGGKPIAKGLPSRLNLKLIDQASYSTGLIMAHYAR